VTTVSATRVGFRHAARRRRRAARPGTHAGVTDIDLDACAGEVLGILGPNGAGKTTLLRLLATALPPQDGELRILGDDARRPSPALRRRLGYAADECTHFDALSGLDNVLWAARAAGASRAEAEHAAAALFERLGMAEYAAARVATYSLGTRRKLTLCAALARRPELLLCDEPTLGLDANASAAFARLALEHAASGATVVIASNDLPLASRVCDRVIFLADGRTALSGRPRELLHGVGDTTCIRFRFRAPRVPSIATAGVTLVHVATDGAEVRTAHGAAALPALCAELLDQDVDIAAIEVRDADLRDVFRTLTGRPWEDSLSPSSPSREAPASSTLRPWTSPQPWP
jgi:ABC-2 type transport system ATP-binding protein